MFIHLKSQFVKTISAIAASARIAGHNYDHSEYGVTLRDAYQKLITEAAAIDAFCIPMMCSVQYINANGKTLYTSTPVLIGEEIEDVFVASEISPSLGEPHTITRRAWRIDLDMDKIAKVSKCIRQIKIIGFPTIDIDKLPDSTLCFAPRINNKKPDKYSIMLNPKDVDEPILLKTIDLPDPQSLDAEFNRPAAVESNLETIALSEPAGQTSLAKDNEVAHFESSEARDFTDDAVNLELAATESQCLTFCRNIMDGISSRGLAPIAKTISRVCDKKTLRYIRQSSSEIFRYKNADSTDTVVIPPCKPFGDMCAQTDDFNGRIYGGNPLPVCVGHKPGLPVTLQRRIREMSKSVTAYKKSLHISNLKSEIEHPQAVIHNRKMGINRCIGDNHSVSNPYSVRREVPYAFDTGCNHRIGNVLCAVDRHGNNTYSDIQLLYQLFKSVYMINRYTSDFSPDNFIIDVDTGHYVKTVALKPRIRDECCPEAA